MAQGEYTYDEIFVGEEPPSYPNLAYQIWVLFILSIPLLFANMLVSG